MSRAPNVEAALRLPDGRVYDVQAVRVLSDRCVVEVQEHETQTFIEFWVSYAPGLGNVPALLLARTRIRAYLNDNRQNVPLSRCDRAVVIELK